MKCIVAGSREIVDYNLVVEAFTLCPFADTINEIVSGGARGVDKLGEKLSEDRDLSLSKFLADWNGLGKKAGIVRNCQMGDYADVLIAVWNGSNGTKHMIKYMKSLKKPVFVCIVKGDKITGHRYYK